MKQAAKRNTTLKPSRTKVNSRGELTAVSSVNYWTGVAIKVAVALAILGAFVWIISPTAHAGDEPHTETVIVAPVPDHQISVVEQQLEAGAVESEQTGESCSTSHCNYIKVPVEQAEEVLPDFPIAATSEFLVCVSDSFSLSGHFNLSIQDRVVFLKDMISVCRQYNELGDDIDEYQAGDLFMQQIGIAAKFNITL